MIILPEFTQDLDNEIKMYFAVDGDKSKLEKAINETYYCYSSLRYITKDGREYLELTVDNLYE